MREHGVIEAVNAGVGLLAVILLAGCAGGDGLGDVGGQDDQPPVARAAAVGASEKTTGIVSVRAGSDVILTGKDSEDLDDPILDFSWQASDSSVDLVERTTSSVVLKAPPNVDAARDIDVELTVTNADGVTASDTVTIRVEPIGDLDEFLVNPNVSVNDNNKFKLRAALPDDMATPLASSENFTVTLDLIAHWPNRLDTNITPCVERESRGEPLCEKRRVGGRPSLDGSAAELSGTWPVASEAGFSQDFTIAIPSLDVDEINKHFQDPNPNNAFRNKRLELDAVGRAYIEVKAALSAGVPSLLKFGHGNEEVELQGLPSAAVVSVDADEIRQALCLDSNSGNTCVESKASAQAYYDVLDPGGNAARLSNWLSYAGFGSDPENQPGIAHAVYVNNFDLGFGRDMFMREDACGNLYSYVVNYTDLENAVLKTNDFATVVMEYSPIDNSGTQDDPAACAGIANNDEKIVKFYAYVPDESTSDYVRMTSMNFDGRGEKFLPGVCTNCHSGTSNINVKELVAFGGQDAAQKLAATADERKRLANLQSSFMPWDLDSFLYAGPEGGAGVEPSYSRDEEVAAKFLSLSRDDQSEPLRQLNAMTMQMWSHYQNANPLNQEPALNGANPRSFAAAMEMMRGWYGGEGGVETPQQAFDGSWVPTDWLAEAGLYEDVFVRNCRMCHVQIEDAAIDFHSYEEFLNISTDENGNTQFGRLDLLSEYVFQRGIMPLARLTMDRFWLDFNSNESAANLFRDHINSVASPAQEVLVDAVPGRPVAQFTATQLDNEPIGDLVELDASSSLFADELEWSLSSDCGSAALLSNTTEQVASFRVDQSPCTFAVNLLVTRAGVSDNETQEVAANRQPASANFQAPLDAYTPGDSSLLIDVLSQISNVGDGDLSVQVGGEPDLTNNGDGTITLSFPPLAGVDRSIEYQLQDVNGTESASPGFISVDIDPIVPQLIVTGVAASSADLEWAVPTGFAADGYNVYRDANLVSSVGGATFSFSDTGLGVDQSFDYQVSAVLDGAESTLSNVVTASTASGVPTGLSSTATTSSITLTWADGPGGEPDDYHVYRNGSRVQSNHPNRSYSDTGLASNTEYRYEVTANFGGSESNRSDELVAATEPQPPTGLSAAAISATEIRLSWTAAPGGVDGYKVLRNSSPISSTLFDSAGTSFTDSGRDPNTLYRYEVRSVGFNGQSANSNSSSATTLVSFTDTVFPILEDARNASCAAGGCHNSASAQGGFNVTGNSGQLFSEITVDESGSRVDTGAPNYIIRCIKATGGGCGSMGNRSSSFGPGELDILERWITQGARDN